MGKDPRQRLLWQVPRARWRLRADARGAGQNTCSGCTLGSRDGWLTCFRDHFVLSPSVPGRSGLLRAVPRPTFLHFRSGHFTLFSESGPGARVPWGYVQASEQPPHTPTPAFPPSHSAFFATGRWRRGWGGSPLCFACLSGPGQQKVGNDRFQTFLHP